MSAPAAPMSEGGLGEPGRRWLGAVGGASAFAFAGVLAFAAVVSGLAAALALAGVLARAIMDVFRVGGEEAGGADG